MHSVTEAEATTSGNGAADGMSKGDRDTIATLMRRNERVAKADARRLAAERLADVEAKLSAQFAADDVRWAAMVEKAKEVVASANAEIRRLCIEDGVPERFAPSLGFGWNPRGENTMPERRTELRMAARARVAALEKTALAEIERRSVAAQTALLAGGLTSDAARQALADMPSAEALLPEVSVEELRALAERDQQNREAGRAALLAGLVSM